MSKKVENAVSVNVEEIKAQALIEAKQSLQAQAEQAEKEKEEEKQAQAQAVKERLQNAVSRLSLICQKVGKGKSDTLNSLNSFYLVETVNRLGKSVKMILLCQIVENACICLEKDLIQSEVEEKQGAKRKEKLMVKNNPKALAFSLLCEMQSVIIKEEKVRKQAQAYTYF
jgi:hypothetical protein